ncbi:hypothetical protein [Rhodopila sp.]|jgi:hypothetical protein|uniref:hypothetical protein n=1 Tax=Rhodopila sp. TaxID=2480087 RepID=UPI002CA24C68|nr:hypothetical protein [Rhodopila sp.]HVZ10150.1 hypothetical protein [Rhodopila sp.]
MAKGLLLVAFDFTNAHEDEFHDWYDLEHVPERQRVAGFGLCERWISTQNPKQAVASYDLDSLSVLDSPAYRAIAGDNLSVWSKRMTKICRRLLRFDGEQTLPGNADSPRGAGGLLVNAMNVLPEHEAEFNEWYDQEHIPALAAVPGVLAARRFRDPKGTHRYLALYHLQSADIPNGPAWQKAANSPWTDKLRPYFRDHVRLLTKRYTRSA